jgi:hypothetical protein
VSADAQTAVVCGYVERPVQIAYQHERAFRRGLTAGIPSMGRISTSEKAEALHFFAIKLRALGFSTALDERDVSGVLSLERSGRVSTQVCGV